MAARFADFLCCILLLLLLLVVTPATSGTLGNDSVEVVVHPSIAIRNISRNSLRAIFGMRLRAWQDGSPIRVFVLPDEAPLHHLFAKEKLNIFPYQLRSAWDRLIFSGTGQAPFLVNSEEEMRVRVATTSGAIGYLKRVNIDDGIQILHVE
ncbi:MULTISPECIES: type 2 periplasmic-binding domain-containing protein [Nitrosomonas]|uniref:PBP domain-containing protein n=1 Tax=Nitrosomonas communis TaxID=44574 RepID=A0A5D3YJ46_9PROT|nr:MULTISPECIES: hypothetical protein [Nitrosomonas]TYP92361.1 hypothetical protein BCL69_100646 [Nitrosomonas communis]UVS62773.1 hypothetical protein NX761_06595 [Nitrosomonas sp. PLL12]